MPWKECDRMDERLRFVARLLDGEKMAAVCRNTLREQLNAASITLASAIYRQEHPIMRIFIALVYLFAATLLISCDRQQKVSDIDPKLGRECFESQRASLPPGTQYEGIDEVAENRLRIRIMNGVDVTTIECVLNRNGTLQGIGR